MKSGVIPASSSNTRAHTLPEWEENFLSSSLVRSGWTTLAIERKTSAILLPVKYFVVLLLLTKNSHGLGVQLAELLGSEENPVCGSNQTDVWVNIVCNQCYGLSVLPILLYSVGDTQFGWEYVHIFAKRMDGDGHSILILKFPVSGDESFGDASARWVFMLLDCGLGLLCIFCTSQAGNSYQSEPVDNDRFNGVLAFRSSWKIQQSSKHLPGDGVSLICNVFFFLTRGDDFCTHVLPVG
jgi:hypothetical protein